ncbi:MAG: hypothetical protein R3A47_07805 [Polyangiales bacterium]
MLKDASSIATPYQESDAFHSARALYRADENAKAIKGTKNRSRLPEKQLRFQAQYLAAWLALR